MGELRDRLRQAAFQATWSATDMRDEMTRRVLERQARLLEQQAKTAEQQAHTAEQMAKTAEQQRSDAAKSSRSNLIVAWVVAIATTSYAILTAILLFVTTSKT